MSYLRTGVTLRANLLGTNPVGLPKMKVPKSTRVKLIKLLDSCSNAEHGFRDGVLVCVSESQVVDIGKNQLYLNLSKL